MRQLRSALSGARSPARGSLERRDVTRVRLFGRSGAMPPGVRLFGSERCDGTRGCGSLAGAVRCIRVRLFGSERLRAGDGWFLPGRGQLVLAGRAVPDGAAWAGLSTTSMSHRRCSGHRSFTSTWLPSPRVRWRAGAAGRVGAPGPRDGRAAGAAGRAGLPGPRDGRAAGAAGAAGRAGRRAAGATRRTASRCGSAHPSAGVKGITMTERPGMPAMSPAPCARYGS